MVKKYKPTLIETYECPICKIKIFGSLKEAEKHVNIPIDVPLPTGFVYKKIDKYFIVGPYGSGSGIIDTMTKNPKEIHGFNQCCLVYNPNATCLESKFGNTIDINSKNIKKDLTKGKVEFLSEKEFEEFKKDYHRFWSSIKPVKSLKRKDLGLEQLVQSTQKGKKSSN